MFGFSKKKREYDRLRFENSVLNELHSQDKKRISYLKKEKETLENETNTIASDALRKGSSVAGKYLSQKRIQKNERL
ncbi:MULTISPECIES: hypothetical protein [Streptococcus]|jgi:hypothetical protein|uniref:Uncharacterized protein n=2 Tax=Streptococcus TaxID=1301 RepID=A0A3R9JEB6_STRMT|nr:MULTISPECIES: hypothetical protein [Streptococcus]QPT01365.1 hypothetical protein I6G42_07350 [Streptococcus oralis]RSJ05434.1 hypothetical protein D8838_01880 [Streptococcus mitis]CAK1608852.1 hypothetical protein SDENT7746_05560 [Streptococcus oralis subsp. dentisani]